MSEGSNYTFRFGTYGSKQMLNYNGREWYKDKDGNLHHVYLCPWELKHVDSISVSVSGTTSTMGIPNKPSSRTQIFDTSGAVLTFKINGRRYDQEEAISNWDFVNTQFNFQEDPVFGKPLGPDNPSEDNKYCYVGLNWLLSCMQILLKGYLLYIDNTDMDDLRFIFKRSDSSPPEEGYNVALTQVSATFSDQEPGLLEYSLTLVMRFKRGESLYRPYVSSGD